MSRRPETPTFARQAFLDWIGGCHCDEGFSGRDMTDPICHHCAYAYCWEDMIKQAMEEEGL